MNDHWLGDGPSRVKHVSSNTDGNTISEETER
jgi:hypothetical protein